MSTRIKELLAQPECEPVAWMQDSIELYVLKEKNILRGYVIPLYTAPPKPEQEPINFDLERMKLAVEAPVSHITGEELMKQVKSNRVFYQEGYAQAELDLKREPLSDDDEIILAYRGLVKRFIGRLQKTKPAHGIGGGE